MLFPKHQIKKILVIQLRAIGDVVLSTAALSLLRSFFENSEIHFLCSPPSDSLLNGLSSVDQVLLYPFSPRNLLGAFKVLPEIKHRAYDLVIDYQGTPGTAFLTRFSGAKFRLGWKIPGRQWAYNLHSLANQKQEYVAIQKCRMLKELGINHISSKTEISLNKNDLMIVESYLNSLDIKSHQLLINITPKGKRQARSWFPEKIARLADLLIEKHQAVVFYSYAPGEKQYIEQIKKMNRFEVHMLPDWKLSTFAAFLSRVNLHFSYDNGPKHIAIALGIPTVSLFATDPPVLWNPMDNPNHISILADVPCKFCGLRECHLMICMKKIEPEVVLAEIENLPEIQKKLNKSDSRV
jgi:ADP-heptose:LPS heptosyltransferase